MQPPVEHLGARSRASSGQAAWFVSVCAASVGLLSGVLMTAGLLLGQDTGGVLEAVAAASALLSWVLAVAAVLTAATALESDRSERRARTAMVAALPGAVAGTVAIVLVIAWLMVQVPSS